MKAELKLILNHTNVNLNIILSLFSSIFRPLCPLFPPPALFPPSLLHLQIDLEPEGKVYVIIDLSGSSSEGKNAIEQTR